MPTVYSTLTNDSAYVHYHKTAGNDLPSVKKKVTIQGGAGRGAKGLITPYGVATVVTDEDLEFLEGNDQFKKHVSRGFLTVVKGTKPENANKVGADMAQDDGSRPQNANKMKEVKENGVAAASPAEKKKKAAAE